MADIITGMILLLCVGGACYHIYRNRKKGVNCIGCPCAGSCSKGCGQSKKTRVNISNRKIEKMTK